MTTAWQCAEPTGVGAPASRDAALIARVLAGERELFHELVCPYERKVYSVILPILRNREEAEDAAQEAVLKALKNLHTFRAESRFSTWLISIAVNEARVRLRRERVLRFESLDRATEGESRSLTTAITGRREIPLQALERKELRHTLQLAIASLPGIYREVLLLRDVKELNIRETIAVLGVSDAVVKTRLLRARLMMRKILTQHRAAHLNVVAKRETGSPTELRSLRGRGYDRLWKRLRANSSQKNSAAMPSGLNTSTQLITGTNEITVGAFHQGDRVSCSWSQSSSVGPSQQVY